MADPVLLLVGPGVLVLFDDIVVVVVDRGAGDDAGLGPAAHGLGIDIVAGGLVLDEAALADPAVQEVARLPVDAVVIDVDAFGQGGLGPVDREEGPRMVLYIGAGLLPGVDVIGKGGDLRCQAGRGSAGAEGAYICHIFPPKKFFSKNISLK